MEKIKVSNEYFIIIEEYENLKVGDSFKNQSELMRKICYPTPHTPLNTNEKRVKEIIFDKLIRFDKVGGNAIKLNSIEPPTKIKEFSETLKPQRQQYKPHRDYLLDYIVYSYADIPLYLSTSQIIRDFGIFTDFYYSFLNLHYDYPTATAAEYAEFMKFAVDNGVADIRNYFENIAEKLSDILYDVFDQSNIKSWAKNRNVNTERVLYQNGAELDAFKSADIEENYFKPLKDKGVPAKSWTKRANREFIADHNLIPEQHKWFYYVYKFEKPPNFLNGYSVNDKLITHHQSEINRKIIEKLKEKAKDPHGGNYHAQNIDNLNKIIGKIKI